MGIIRTSCYLITLTLFCQDTGPCSDNPCMNGGTCSSVNEKDYVCDCEQPYSGKKCEISTQCKAAEKEYRTDKRIANAGNGILQTACYLATLTFFCQDPCDPNPCQNDGECSADGTDFTCSCNSPYSGKQCDTRIVCEEFENPDWTYNGITNGPDRWGESYPTCSQGQMQSPIAHLKQTAVKNEDLEPLEMTNYDHNVTKAELINNGHTVRITPQDDVVRSISIEGDTYTLTHVDFHFAGTWKSGLHRGSEHQHKDRTSDMEIQYFHKNDNDDIAVVAVLCSEPISKKEQFWNRGFIPISDVLAEIRYKDQKTHLKDPLDLTSLMPTIPFSFYRYTGSLTTPPCTEGVTWSVAMSTIDVNEVQKDEFDRLYTVVEQDEEPTERESYMYENVRPVQPLNGRTVTMSI